MQTNRHSIGPHQGPSFFGEVAITEYRGALTFRPGILKGPRRSIQRAVPTTHRTTHVDQAVAQTRPHTEREEAAGRPAMTCLRLGLRGQNRPHQGQTLSAFWQAITTVVAQVFDRPGLPLEELVLLDFVDSKSCVDQRLKGLGHPMVPFVGVWTDPTPSPA